MFNQKVQTGGGGLKSITYSAPDKDALGSVLITNGSDYLQLIEIKKPQTVSQYTAPNNKIAWGDFLDDDNLLVGVGTGFVTWQRTTKTCASVQTVHNIILKNK